MGRRESITRHPGWRGALLAVIIALLGSGQAAAQEGIRVLLNAREIDFAGAEPEEVSNRVLVPLRGVFEAMGARVDYDPTARSITAVRGSTRVELTIDSVRATVNGRERTLDVPAQVRANRTLVPLRFVSEALGADVRWSSGERTVFITDSWVTPPPPPVARAPEWFIELRSTPPGAEVYLVSEYDWETIPNILDQIDQDPDLAVNQVEGPTNIEVPRPLVVYRAVFIRGGVKRVMPVQPVPILPGQKRKGWAQFP
jgi:hypothetical protein